VSEFEPSVGHDDSERESDTRPQLTLVVPWLTLGTGRAGLKQRSWSVCAESAQASTSGRARARRGARSRDNPGHWDRRAQTKACAGRLRRPRAAPRQEAARATPATAVCLPWGVTASRMQARSTASSGNASSSAHDNSPSPPRQLLARSEQPRSPARTPLGDILGHRTMTRYVRCSSSVRRTSSAERAKKTRRSAPEPVERGALRLWRVRKPRPWHPWPEKIREAGGI